MTFAADPIRSGGGDCRVGMPLRWGDGVLDGFYAAHDVASGALKGMRTDALHPHRGRRRIAPVKPPGSASGNGAAQAAELSVGQSREPTWADRQAARSAPMVSNTGAFTGATTPCRRRD